MRKGRQTRTAHRSTCRTGGARHPLTWQEQLLKASHIGLHSGAAGPAPCNSSCKEHCPTRQAGSYGHHLLRTQLWLGNHSPLHEENVTKSTWNLIKIMEPEAASPKTEPRSQHPPFALWRGRLHRTKDKRSAKVQTGCTSTHQQLIKRQVKK